MEKTGRVPLKVIDMASCLKCGKAKLRRDKQGRRKCRHCGVMPSAKQLDQGGNPRRDEKEQANVWKTCTGDD